MRCFALNCSVFAFFLLSVCLCSAQDDKLDKFSFEDVPKEDNAIPYFAVGGGFAGSFFSPKLDVVNSLLGKFISGQSLNSTIFLKGAQGFVGIPFIKNSRIGFMGLAGSSSVDGSDAGKSHNRHFEYGVNLTGFTFDYGFTPMRSLAILPGFMLGWSSLNIEMSQSNTSPQQFSDSDSIGVSTSNYTHRIASNSSVFIEPHLNVEYAFTQFSMLRVAVGYPLQLGKSSWTADNLAPVNNVPDEIAAKGLNLHIGIFVGLFNN